MTVGAALAEGRRMAGLSLEDVSAVTRLRPAMIAALEADDYSLCGGDTYARGHIRSVAQAVGIDADVVVAEFNSTRTEVAQPGSMRRDFENGRRSIEDAPRSPSWNRVIAVAAIVILVILFIALVLRARG